MDKDSIFNEIQAEVRERYLPRCLDKCPNHELLVLTDISLEDCGSELIFKCRNCQKSNKYLKINEIAYSEDSHIFNHYPIIPEDLRQKIREILEQKESNQKMVDYIRRYFENLKSQILQSISDMEEEMTVKAQEIDSFQKNLIDEQNKQSRKIELRDIIFDDQSITQKSEQVKTIVQDVVEKSNQIQQKLMEMIAKFDQNNENIKEQNLNEISNFRIQSCIQQIKTKEIMKLNQINEIEILKDQNINEIKELIKNTIDIKKIKLKAGNLETISEALDKIEEILKKKTGTSIEIDFSFNSIGKYGAQHLSNAIAQLNNLTCLNLNLLQKNALTKFHNSLAAHFNPLENESND